MGKCVFSPKWVSSYPWVMKAEDKYKAYCKSCKKTFDLGKIGECALKSCKKSEKHKLNVRSLSQPVLDAFSVPPPPSVLWTFHTIVNHNSYKSNESTSKLFKMMFLDSKIAEKFHCGERKTAYFTVFGIAEYLKSSIVNDMEALTRSANMQIKQRKKEISPIFPNPML